MPARLPALPLVGLLALAACESPPPAPAPPPSAAVPAAIEPAPPTPAPTATAAEREPPAQIAAQHILVAYKGAQRAPRTVTRSKAEAQKRADEAAAKAKGGQDFAALVKEYSDEPDAAARLGSLGRFNRDVMARPFTDAAFALEVGEISGSVETPFGFHVIKRNQ